jgi:hypothetical protein
MRLAVDWTCGVRGLSAGLSAALGLRRIRHVLGRTRLIEGTTQEP